MTLVDDYLRAVALLLPREKREDIIDELRELILSRIESREAELGRTLTDDETEQVLRDLGHPLVVASRYRDGPQHVVGPAVYPFWVFAVKAAVTIQLALALVVFVVRIVAGDPARAGDAISGGFTGALILIGLATVAAWMIERGSLRIQAFDKWRVKDLRFLGFAAWDADAWGEWLRSHGAWPRSDSDPPTGGGAARSSQGPAMTSAPASSIGAARPGADARTVYDRGRREQSDRRYGNHPERYRYAGPIGRGLGGVAVGVVLLLWWVGALHFGIAAGADDLRTLGIEPGALAGADWPGLKTALYLPVLAYVGLIVAQGAVRIAHPDAVRVQGLLDLAIAAVVLATVGWIWSWSPIASAVRVETVAGFAQRMRDLFQDGPPFPLAPGLSLVLAVVAFGAVIRGVKGLFELVVPVPPVWTPPLGRGI